MGKELISKWKITGLLDEIRNKELGAQVLENTAQKLLSELTTGTANEIWHDNALHLMIKVYAETGKIPDYKLVKSLYLQFTSLAGDSLCFSIQKIEELVINSYKEKKRL